MTSRRRIRNTGEVVRTSILLALKVVLTLRIIVGRESTLLRSTSMVCCATSGGRPARLNSAFVVEKPMAGR